MQKSFHKFKFEQQNKIKRQQKNSMSAVTQTIMCCHFHRSASLVLRASNSLVSFFFVSIIANQVSIEFAKYTAIQWCLKGAFLRLQSTNRVFVGCNFFPINIAIYLSRTCKEHFVQRICGQVCYDKPSEHIKLLIKTFGISN